MAAVLHLVNKLAVHEDGYIGITQQIDIEGEDQMGCFGQGLWYHHAWFAALALKKLVESPSQPTTCRMAILSWHDLKIWSDGSCEVPDVKEGPTEWLVSLSCSPRTQSSEKLCIGSLWDMAQENPGPCGDTKDLSHLLGRSSTSNCVITFSLLNAFTDSSLSKGLNYSPFCNL